MKRTLAALLLGAALALGGASAAGALPPEATPSFALDVSKVWQGTSVPTASIECWQNGPAATVTCVTKDGSGPAIDECFGQASVFACTGEDYAAATGLECVGWPSGMNPEFSGFRLCVNGAAMTEYLDSAAAGAPRVGIDFQCGPDPACKLQQDLAASTTQMALENIRGAMSNTAFTTDGSFWVGATTEFSWWRWAVVLVTVVAMAWGITVGLLKQDGPMVRSAVIGGILAWPAAELAVWTLGHLLNVSERLTQAVMGANASGSFDAQIADLANSGTYDDQAAVVWSSLILALGSFVLTFVFAFRNLALMVLVAFAPLAFMLAPVRPGVRIITVWASAVLALIITKPLTMGLLSLILTTGAEMESLWVPEALPLLFGIILTAFMPLVAFTLFDFVGTQAASSAEGAGRAVTGSAIRGGQSAARSAGYQIRSRAHIPSAGGGSPAGGGTAARPPAIPRSPGAGSGAAGRAGGGVPNAPTPQVTPPTPRPSGGPIPPMPKPGG